MDIENLSEGAGEFTSHSYLVEGKALIDAGKDYIVLNRLEGINLEKIIVTHSHHDHIENLELILNKHNPKIYAFAPDKIEIETKELKDGEKVMLGEKEFEVIHTPGHTEDSICLYNKEEKILFSGDTVFPNGIFGRTDLKDGDNDKIVRSVEKLAELDVKKIFPGHGHYGEENGNQHILEALEKAKEELKEKR
ncbi:MAG: MBL fold metallo-hydrolase [Candidatus Nanohaloarchaeota archaeon QJJ-9]|nr:MBL fold metallo-hydrolase [Candidatus Nanohaloarchaeota archaeon QJJ-9]